AAELRNLAETISAPVTHTLMGLGCFPSEHPLFLGMLGLHGTRYANLAVTECDCLIAVGARFDDRVVVNLEGFAPNAKIIHIDIDPAEIGKNVRPFLPIVGDVKLVLESILQLLKKRKNSEWVTQVQEWKSKYPLSYSSEGSLKPQFVIEKICEQVGGSGIIVTDVGQHQMWAAQYYKFNEPHGFITSGGLGTMGFGLPAAIGAQMGAPGRPVILITGDGSIQMTLQELATAVEQKLPLKIFVINNRQLGMVRQLQEFYCDKRHIAVDFQFDLDFAALGKVYGMAGYIIKTPEQLMDQLPEILASEEPVMVNCLVSGEENVLPMVLAGSNINEAID
ncbi:MAG: thiamine pyrophosphate-dependent enzyme, partial [Desulfotomaculaceae bacterium]|nr:thiamine pyrophosphate-dependent enzyme [Desulfotomaculaceae bacterium]